MKLFRKKSSKTSTGRQRLRDSTDQPATFSYHAARRSEQELNVGRQTQRAQPKATDNHLWRFWLQRFGFVVLLVAMAISLVNVLSLSTSAKVLPLDSGNNSSFLRDRSTYQAAADKLLAGSIWNRNKITIDTARFSRQMVDQFPELASVSVALPLLAHRPVVYLQPAQPALILAASNGSFVLDTNGKALSLSADMPAVDQQNLPTISDQSGLKVRLNRQILTTNDVNFIQTVVAQLSSHHVMVSSMVLPPAASELDVHLVDQPYFIKFNLQHNNARQQAGTFLATIAQLQRQHSTPAHYVDVRVDGRAYYQ